MNCLEVEVTVLPTPSYEPHNDTLERLLLFLGVPCGAALLFVAWWMWPASIEQDPIFVLASIVAAIAGALLLWNVLTCLLAHIATSRFLPRLVASGMAAIIQRIGSPAARQILARRSATAALAMALFGGGHSAMASPLPQTPPSPPHPDHTQSAPSHHHDGRPIPDNLQWPLPRTETSPSAPAQPSMPAAPSPGAEPNPLDIPPSPSSSHEGGAPADNPLPVSQSPAAPSPPSVSSPPALQVEDLQPQEPNPLDLPARDTPTPAAETPNPEVPAPHGATPSPQRVDIDDPTLTLPGQPDPTDIPVPAETPQSAQLPAPATSPESSGAWLRHSFDSAVEMLSAPKEDAAAASDSEESAAPRHPSGTPQEHSSRTPQESPTDTVPAPTAATSQGSHTVEEGDSLWGISRDILGHEASDAEIADAWPRIYEENRDLIGDSPDLIHPGDVLTLPKELT